MRLLRDLTNFQSLLIRFHRRANFFSNEICEGQLKIRNKEFKTNKYLKGE